MRFFLVAAAVVLSPGPSEAISGAMSKPPSSVNGAAADAPAGKAQLLREIDAWRDIFLAAPDPRFDRFEARLREIKSQVLAANDEAGLVEPGETFRKWKENLAWLRYSRARGEGLTAAGFAEFCAQEGKTVAFSLAFARGIEKMQGEMDLLKIFLDPTSSDGNFGGFVSAGKRSNAFPGGSVPMPTPVRVAPKSVAERYAPVIKLLKDRGVPENLVTMAIQIAESRHVHPLMALAIIEAESNFNPNATSYERNANGDLLLGRDGKPISIAHGLMQLTADKGRNLYDPANNVRLGVSYIQSMLEQFAGKGLSDLARINPFSNGVKAAIAAYNAGPGAVARFGGIPPYEETKQYVKRVLNNFKEFAGALKHSLGRAS